MMKSPDKALSERDAEKLLKRLDEKKRQPPGGTRKPDEPSFDSGDGSGQPRRKPSRHSGR